jgi:hypothetical protein
MQRILLVVLSVVLPQLLGCAESPITTIDRASDCAEICDRYKDCLSSDYNTAKCRDHCTDMKDSKETEKIDRCQACIKENSCTGSVFKCTTACVGIVP